MTYVRDRLLEDPLLTILLKISVGIKEEKKKKKKERMINTGGNIKEDKIKSRRKTKDTTSIAKNTSSNFKM